MRIRRIDPPRKFSVGGINLEDCARIDLDPDEQITLTTPSGGEIDVTRKEWGFYLGSSLNSRMVAFGLRSVLVKNTKSGKYNVFVVEKGHEPAFDHYLSEQGHEIVSWLDGTQALDRFEGKA